MSTKPMQDDEGNVMDAQTRKNQQGYENYEREQADARVDAPLFAQTFDPTFAQTFASTRAQNTRAVHPARGGFRSAGQGRQSRQQHGQQTQISVGGWPSA